jgi:hypothetical protein
MSSLLQFQGTYSARGVDLQFVKVVKGPEWDRYNGPSAYQPRPNSTVGAQDDPAYVYPCPTCGRSHARIFVATRRPTGMFGPWVTFRFNGATHAPDLSIPISVFRLPRGTRPMSEVESSAVWHS